MIQDTVRVTSFRGHATDEDVERGHARAEDQLGKPRQVPQQS